jgi:hypothetical protein
MEAIIEYAKKPCTSHGVKCGYSTDAWIRCGTRLYKETSLAAAMADRVGAWSSI